LHFFFSWGGNCITLFNCLFCFQKKWQQASTVSLPLLSPFLWQRYGSVDVERRSLHVVITEALSLSTLVAQPGPAQHNVWVNDRLIVTVLIYLGRHTSWIQRNIVFAWTHCLVGNTDRDYYAVHILFVITLHAQYLPLLQMCALFLPLEL
jgi:hypothetical protein